MKVRLLVAPLALVALLAACGGGAEESDPTAVPTEAPTEAAASPTPGRGVTTGEVGSGRSLRSSDGNLEVASAGRAPLQVTVSEMGADAPRAPRGWTIGGKVYEITAVEPGGGAVTRLADALELRFKVAERLATVMYFDGQQWVMVKSDLAEGVLRTAADHLTAFAVMIPGNVRAVPTATPTPGQATPPSATTTGTPVTPVAATATAVNPEDAKAALEKAIEKWRKEPASVTNAGGYDGTAAMEQPDQLTEALAGAHASKALYHGAYNGVNEAFVVGGIGGEFAVLIEPRVDFPSSSTQAQRMLAESFPGATGQVFVAVKETSAMYTYQAATGDGFIILGFIEHEGLPLAFLSVGTGGFVAPAIAAKD